MNSFLCHASRASTTRRLSRPTAWIHQIPSTTRRSILIQQSTTSSHQASLSRPNHVSRPLAFASSVRWMSDSSKEDETSVTPSDKSNTKRRSSKKKFKVVDSIEQHHVDKLAQAFDEMARKEGFTSDTAFFADESVFDDDDDEAFIDDDEDDDDDPLFFPSDDDDNDDMEARIAAARQDIVSGQVTVPKELDSFAGEVSADELRKLGFRREANPFGDDETPRKEQFKLVTNALVCPACGAGFQCHKESRPGFLPPEKFEVQVKLSKIEELQTLKEKADAEDEWSAEDEIEWLIQSSESSAKPPDGESDVGDIDIEEMAEDLGLDLAEVSKRQVVCKRCHELQNFGKVAETLRPGWTSEPLLSQEKFRELLRPIRDKKAVLIALVDLFDFSGSVLPELDNIAGENPVILAANKADLLPSSMGKVRAENWVRRELEYLGVRSLANIGGAVRLVSCKTGMGVGEMMTKARALAEEMDCDIYVVGAANAGKSTLLNHILASPSNAEGSPEKKKIRAGNRNSRKGVLTTSPLPGTTLEFIKVDLGGRNLFDTPGLLVDGTLTQLLTPEELKIVVPKKKVEPITFRVAAGKCVLVGGLARIELIGDSKPFLFTFFVANDIKLHPTDVSRADDFVQKHIGEMLTPPLQPGLERLEQMGKFEEHVVDIQGMGWKEAAADIALTGLGWVAVTGAGSAKVKISVPKGIGISVRPPLMPYDIWETTARYTGSRAVRRTKKSASGKRRRGVGRN